MIEDLMKEELSDLFSNGYTIYTGSDGDDTFFFYLIASGNSLTGSDEPRKNIYGYMRNTKRMTPKETAFAASYFLRGMLEGRGETSRLNVQEVSGHEAI